MSIPIRLDAGGAIITAAVYSKGIHFHVFFWLLQRSTIGFILFGVNGFVSFFERSDDKREPFIESRRLLLGGSLIPTSFESSDNDGNTIGK